MRCLCLLSAILALNVGCELIDHDDLDDAEVSALFESAHEDEQDSKADAARCSGVRLPDRGSFGKQVALTFDDGPNPLTTPRVMAILRERNVPATFFINGFRVNSDSTQRIVEDIVTDPLFELANHTWSHPNMKQQSASEVARQIDDTTSVIDSAGGRLRYFRFPYGASSCSTAQAVRDRGYTITGWHIDSADWCFSTGSIGLCPESQFRFVDDDVRDDMLAYTMRQIRARQGGVVLFHDIHSYTVSKLERFLDQLDEEGFVVVPLDDESVFPRLNDAPPVVEEGVMQGRVTTDLWLRSGPDSRSSGILVMSSGSIVTLTGNTDGDWLEIRFGATGGWAHGRFIERL